MVARGGDTTLIARPSEHELFEGLRDSRTATGGGIVRDVLYAGRMSAEAAFEIARATSYAWFAVGSTILGYQAQLTETLGLGAASVALETLDTGLQHVHKITKTSLDVSEQITKASIEAFDAVLAAQGSVRGDAIRWIFSDQHTKEALLCVTRLLGKLGMDLKTRNPVKLLSGARALAQAHQLNKMDRIRDRQEKLRLAFVPKICPDVIQRWNLFMHYSIASYGYQALQVMGVIPRGVDRTKVVGHKAGIVALTGVAREDIVVTVPGGEMYYPGHYVAIDRINKHVVVVVRGTMNVKDILVDLVCESVKFVSLHDEDDEDTLIEGKAHRGFLIAARRLADELEPVVKRSLEANPGYSVVVTGHSLGAGVATLLTLLWARSKTFGEKENLHAYAFGAPCSLCHELSQAPFTRKYVTSLVVGDDFVSRLSFSTVSEIQKAVMEFATSELELSEEEKLAIYRRIPRDDHEKKLFSAGRVWLLDSPEFNHHAIEIDPRDLLHTLELSSTFLHLHFPPRYLNAIKALAHVWGEPTQSTSQEDTHEQ